MTFSPAPDLDTATAVLAFAEERARDRRAAEADLLYAACCWADTHPAPHPGDAATIVDRFGDTGLTVAGPGAPLVAEFAVPELATAVGLSTEAGKRLIGEALEIRHRLPKLWAAAQDGRVEAWRVRRVAQAVGVPTTDRLVDEAIARHMPALAAEREEGAKDRRGFSIDTDHVSFEGTMRCSGELEIPDAYALDAAVKDEMDRLRDLGSTEKSGPLAAQALVGLACRGTGQDALNLEPADQSTSSRQRERTMVLNLHLADTAVTGSGDGRCTCGRGLDVGRLEETRTPISAGLIREWCGAADTTTVVVRPVRDLTGDVHIEAHEIPHRLKTQANDRHHTCTFPWCTRRATTCDQDHAVAYDHADPSAGGPTCSCNIAPLCRPHHRLKTHGHASTRWTLANVGDAAWLWRSPHGQHYLRDHTGTRALDGPLANAPRRPPDDTRPPGDPPPS